MFLGLRMMEGVSERKFYENFGRRFEEVFPGVIEKHEKLGLLEVIREDAGKIEIKEEPDLKEKCEEQQGKLQESEECQKVQQEEQRKEKQEGKLQQEERGGEFVRLRLTPHGIDVSNQVFVDFML